MAEGPRLVTVGTINGGATEIQADVATLGSDAAVAVTLSTDYWMAQPPGFPSRPGFTGAPFPVRLARYDLSAQFPQTVPSGATILVLQPEAAALIAAGAATPVQTMGDF